MKRLALFLSLAMATAVGCSKEKTEATDNTANTAEDKAAAAKTPTPTTTEQKPTTTATANDTKVAKLLVLKFHHDS